MYEGTDFNSWDQADEMATRAFELYENGEMPEALDQLNEAMRSVSCSYTLPQDGMLPSDSLSR